jgi:hypothetical protein
MRPPSLLPGSGLFSPVKKIAGLVVVYSALECDHHPWPDTPEGEATTAFFLALFQRSAVLTTPLSVLIRPKMTYCVQRRRKANCSNKL